MNNQACLQLKVIVPLITGVLSVIALPITVRSGGSIQDPTYCKDVVGPPQDCTTTPERYELTIYEMGICSSDPLPGGDNSEFDDSSCVKTLDNPNGQKADLTNRASVDLTAGTTYRPPNGTYTHSYLKFSNVIGMRGTVETSQVYYSKSNLDVDGASIPSVTPPAENWDDTVTDIGDTGGCGGTVSWSGEEGTMKALLSCTDASSSDARLIAVYKPDSQLIIDDDTEGLQATFLVENLGLEAGVDEEGDGQPDQFDSAPFRVRIETF